LFNTTICNHMAAVKLFTDSILNKCSYLAYPCAKYDDLKSHKCSLKCEDGQCNRMGYYASPRQGKGKLYLNTQGGLDGSFCSYHYQVSLKSGSDFVQAKGKVILTLVGSLQTATIEFDK
ncbi:unnamed protein product, partial [Didymodactylos carnosus]